MLEAPFFPSKVGIAVLILHCDSIAPITSRIFICNPDVTDCIDITGNESSLNKQRGNEIKSRCNNVVLRILLTYLRANTRMRLRPRVISPGRGYVSLVKSFNKTCPSNIYNRIFITVLHIHVRRGI